MVTTSLVIAHRGASGYRPEHTRSAFELAIAMGADAVEPDIVATKDGVLVVRHENEISGTTDVANRADLAHLRATKTIDGRQLSGWFTEDLTWAQLATLHARERLPALRPDNTAFDDLEPMLRLIDLRDLLVGTGVRMVAEIKHATYFDSVGLPLDDLFADVMRDSNAPLVVESFEQGVLTRIRDRGIAADYVFLAETNGHPADTERSYADHLTPAGLARLADEVDGVSPDVHLLLEDGRDTGLVGRAHDAGLEVFTWTLRREDAFVPKAFGGDWRRWFASVMATGVDGVFADQPDLALEIRSARSS